MQMFFFLQNISADSFVMSVSQCGLRARFECLLRDSYEEESDQLFEKAHEVTVDQFEFYSWRSQTLGWGSDARNPISMLKSGTTFSRRGRRAGRILSHTRNGITCSDEKLEVTNHYATGTNSRTRYLQVYHPS